MKVKKSRRKTKEVSKEDKGIVYSDDEMLDLSNELHSLSHYVDDEDELVVQLFATIKQTKLQSMLPPLLKEIDLKELQDLCLHELRGMSRKRILTAINGMNMSSSSSDEYDEDPLKGGVNVSLTQTQPIKPKEEASNRLQDQTQITVSNISEDSNPDRLRTPPPPPLRLPPQDHDEMDDNPNMNNLTALDILELEMRAKLIKTMLEKQPSEEEDGDAPEGKDMKVSSNDQLLISPSEIKLEPLSPDIKPLIEDEINSSSKRASSRSSYSSHRSRSSSYSSRSLSVGSVRRGRRRSRSDSKSSFSSRSRSASKTRSQSSSQNSSFIDEKDQEGSPNHCKSSPENEKNKKKKITKKEFQERMQKAKLNRRYRKRKDSESDSEDEEGGRRSRRRKKKSKRSRDFYRRASWEVEYFEKLKKELKKGEEPQSKEPASKDDTGLQNDDVEEGEYSSKEEGEIESGEEKEPQEPIEEQVEEEDDEEGACTPSDKEKSPTPPQSKVQKRKSSSGSDSSSPHRHSKRHKKRKKKTIRHSRSRSKTPPLLQKIRRTKKRPTASIGAPLVEPLATQEFKKKLSIRETSNWDSNRHTEPIESDENMEETSNDVKEPSIPVFTKSISFSIAKKGILSSKRNQDTKEIPSEPDNLLPLPSSIKEEVNPAAEPLPMDLRPVQKSSRSKSAEAPEEEIRYVVPCLEMPSSNLAPGPEDLDLLFTDWDLPHGEDLPPDPINYQSTNTLLDNEENSDIAKINEPADTLKDEDRSQNAPIMQLKEEFLPLPIVDTTDNKEPLQQSVDIIGVIEPRNESNSEFDEEFIGGSSWSSRWLQSEKVQNVVSNSKILSKVRKKIQERGKDKLKERIREAPEEPLIKDPVVPKVEAPVVETKVHSPLLPPPPTLPVIGSIEEYEKLIGLKVTGAIEGERQEDASKKEANISVLDSDDDEDSEEEALWSKIMKK